MSLQIRRLSYNLGAEVIGVDIRKPLDDKTFSEVHTAFLEHSILLFRGQPLTLEQHSAFSRRFGELDMNDDYIAARDREYPEILQLRNPKLVNGKPTDTYNGEHWHTDLSYRLVPAMATLLHGVELPDAGGDTMFANMSIAYETLSDGMKKLIDGLYAVHTAGRRSRLIDNSTTGRGAKTQRIIPPVAQPLVRVHPETGRKALYLTARVKQIAGMTAEESAPLTQFLFEHAVRPQFVYRHEWRKDDLIMWDNRCLMHMALGDYDRSQMRHMQRTSVLGTPSGGYVYEGPLQ